METITVQAVYEKGVLKPRKKLDLPEHSLVEVSVKAVKHSSQTAFGSLIGIWEHLSDSEVKSLEKKLSSTRKRSALKIKKISKRK